MDRQRLLLGRPSILVGERFPGVEDAGGARRRRVVKKSRAGLPVRCAERSRWHAGILGALRFASRPPPEATVRLVEARTEAAAAGLIVPLIHRRGVGPVAGFLAVGLVIGPFALTRFVVDLPSSAFGPARCSFFAAVCTAVS